MASDAKRCPSCGEEQSVNAPEGPCPRCLMPQAMTGDPPGPADVDATSARAATATGHSPHMTDADSNTTRAYIPQPDAGATQHPENATGDWAPGPIGSEETTDGASAPRNSPRRTTVRYFGDYELQKELGRGGMGVVYQAKQVSLNRSVALKMIKAGVLADDAELRRFQNEAEAVALLDHPGIVPVYEVGEHQGQRYFSMKLVEGENLGERLATFQDKPKAAATLLAETAEAVHHAHMRGILHRDLKPANILVDAEGRPHVTDFGLAKRVEADVEMTASGAILGTPSYMSPEQAAGRRGTITTATDIYGLGAILYAALTGKAPFGGDSLADTLQAVKERSPEAPRNLNASVPRGLETICLKCLEKDPRRRYASAQAMADDLRCWLDSRPITARRVGSAERAWLWCKRKPAVAALSAAVVLALIGGTTAVFAVQLRANANLRAANTSLELSNKALKKERERVEIRERQAVEAMRRFGDSIANEPVLKNSPALKDLRRRLLGEPIAFFRDLRSQLQADAGTRPESLRALASAAYQLGHLSQTIGDRDDASKSINEAQALLERLVREHPSEEAYQRILANTLYGLAVVQFSKGLPREAHASLERAAGIYTDLIRQNPPEQDYRAEYRRGLARCHLLLGFADHQAGRPLPALELLRKARGEFEQLLPLSKLPSELRSEMVMCDNNAGAVEEALGRFADALVDYRKGLNVADRLVQDNPSVAEYRLTLAQLHGNIGKILSVTGKPVEAEAATEKAREYYESLAVEFPSTTEYQYGFGSAHVSLGGLAAKTGRMNEAEARLSKARQIFERLATEHPESPNFASELGAVLHNLGEMQYHNKHYAQARDLLLQAMASQRKALASVPTNPRYRECADAHLEILGRTAAALGDKETVERVRREKLELGASDPRIAALDERLARVAKGASPSDNAERLALAQRAYDARRYTLAGKLWADAMSVDSKLADQRRPGHRYNAACSAALAGAGQGNETPPLDDTAKAKLRRQGLDWLKAELTVWARLVESSSPQANAFVAQALKHWQEDTDLVGIRDLKELAKLPESEREEWQRLWEEVEALRKRAEGRKP
jgi:serine/threonine protein kinase